MRSEEFALPRASGMSVLGLGVAPAHATVAHALISGSGSGWAANAINQSVADVTPQGLHVVYTGTGSAQGRTDFAIKTVDFAVSDVPYQGTDPITGGSDTAGDREFRYAPIAAGGIALAYHLWSTSAHTGT